MQKKVLLVDDESSLRRSLSLSLSQEGYEIEPCENGISAMKKLEQFTKDKTNIDTIVLDVKLPDIDGIKLGKMFRSKFPETSIIFITGYSDDINSKELENIGISRLLEKPFTAQELSAQIEEIAKEQKLYKPAQKTTQVIKTEDIKTFSAYALLKLDSDAEFFEVYKQLYFDNNVLYCDATTGEYDIFLLIQAHSLEGCKEICDNKIKNIKGIKKLDFLEIANPVLDDSLKNILNVFSIDSSDFQMREFSNAVSAYVLVEIEKNKLESIYPTLYFDDNVIHCDYTDSRYNLVLLVHGTQFSEIDNLIKNKISTLDGVLKVKKFPIISMYEM